MDVRKFVIQYVPIQLHMELRNINIFVRMNISIKMRNAIIVEKGVCVYNMENVIAAHQDMYMMVIKWFV